MMVLKNLLRKGQFFGFLFSQGSSQAIEDMTFIATALFVVILLQPSEGFSMAPTANVMAIVTTYISSWGSMCGN
jgi:hypothetical protein